MHRDVDFLVEFAPGAQPGLRPFSGAKAAVEQLLGRGVDLAEPAVARKPCVLGRHQPPPRGR
ncbi:MAG: hypothetical protein DI587_07055 [Variovorax paradoxus]|nr:MAG: hypothetical protein DI583_07055 [Variovorax paradoxus]PZQ13289.1 MAG: hypothetical protein DI587_07055 [Variovorax paradoxus]